MSSSHTKHLISPISNKHIHSLSLTSYLVYITNSPLMATHSLQSLHHHHHNHHHNHHPSNHIIPSSIFLKPTTTNSHSLSLTFSSTTTFSLPTTTSTTSTSSSSSISSTSLDLLQQHLSTQNFRLADDETRRLIIALAGEAAVKRGYVFFSEVQFIPSMELKAIDKLWKQYSNNKFGYSVQKKIWKKVDRDFTKFFIKVGWMKKLDTEVLQYNYRAFPNEFTWEIAEDNTSPAEGHLPLTNALRGTQLLSCILCHPAFAEDEADEEEEDDDGQDKVKQLMGSKPLSKKVFSTDYTF